MMGSPRGVTHSTVRPDWAMSLALSVSQFFRRGEEAAGVSVELGDPIPSQHRPPSLLPQNSPALTGGFGTIPHLWGRRILSGPGEPSLLMEHPLVYV